MDEFSTEEEQIEEIRKWWSENWKQVVGGLVVGIALIFGYRGWMDAQRTQSERASARYDMLQEAVDSNDLVSAEAVLATLAADYPGTSYLDQAYLAMARMKVENNDLDGAADMLEAALSADDELLVQIARLRLARLRLEQGELDMALELVSKQPVGSFAGLYADVRGDVHSAAGRLDAARAAYEDALALDSENLVNREVVEMKLAMLPAPAGEDG